MRIAKKNARSYLSFYLVCYPNSSLSLVYVKMSVDNSSELCTGFEVKYVGLLKGEVGLVFVLQSDLMQ
jgi:hypothetical protein